MESIPPSDSLAFHAVVPHDGLHAELAEHAEMLVTQHSICSAGRAWKKKIASVCLVYELLQRGLAYERQKPMPLVYRDVHLDCGYRVDLLVENAVVVEVKSITRIEPVHHAQLRSYLRLSGCKVGLLLNFNVKWFSADGIKRIVNGVPG